MVECIAQVAELEAEFEKIGNEKPQQARFLRSQQDLKAKMEEKAAAGGVEDGGTVFISEPGRMSGELMS